MFKKRMIGKRASREIIFEVEIDCDRNGRFSNKHLSLDNIDILLSKDNSRDKKHNFQTALNRAITTDLPADLKHIYGISVQTRVIEWQEGSILIFIGAIITGLSLFANYADFFESIQLVKKHLKLLLNRILDDNDFDIDIDTSFPHLPDPSNFSPLHLMERMFHRRLNHFPIEALEHLDPWFQNSNSQVSKRDGFFWFLLIINIILLGIIGILVGAAVVKTYFP